MAASAKPRATYADLLKVPSPFVAELVHGVLHTNPRPALPHARVSSVLGGDLVGPFDRGRGGPGGWIILDEPELHLGEDVLVPDLAGWRRERMPEVPATPYTELAPDWLCEVLSASTQALDRSDKMDIYAREGVRHLWLIDPGARTFEIYALDTGTWKRLATHRDAAVVRAPPFDAIELELSAMWVATPSESRDR